jgi:hypothetical protein
MKANEAIRTALKSTSDMLNMFLADLSDADLLVRPVPNANHIAWQIGHLISSEIGLADMAGFKSKYPELPAGFPERHNKNTANSDTGFGTKAEYLGLYKKVRDTSIALVTSLSETDLDKPTTGRMAEVAPTAGAVFLLMANHTTMHSGQFSVIRRKLGKPVLM